MLDICIKQIENLSISDNCTIYIFQSNRTLTISESLSIDKLANDFILSWTAHENKVFAKSTIILGHFIVFFIDESKTNLSGCSKDKLNNFIKNINNKFNLDFLNRHLLAFIKNNKIELIPLNQIEYAISNKFITKNTLYFNNVIFNLEQLKSNWICESNNTWLKKYFINENVNV